MANEYFYVDELWKYIPQLKALDIARKERKRVNASRSNNNKNEQKNFGERKHRSDEAAQQSSGDVKDVNAEPDSANEPKCHRCNLKEHIAENGPKPSETKCYNCSEIRHVASDCTKRKKLSIAEVNTVMHTFDEIIAKYVKCVQIAKDPGKKECIDSKLYNKRDTASITEEYDVCYASVASVVNHARW